MGRGLGLFRNNVFLKARRQAKAPTADEQTSGEMSPVEEYLYLHVYDMYIPLYTYLRPFIKAIYQALH